MVARNLLVTMMKNGYDRYLDFQFGMSGGFFTALFTAISKADGTNSSKLALGFPEEVDAYRVFTRVGADEFLDKCSADNPLIDRFRSEM